MGNKNELPHLHSFPVHNEGETQNVVKTQEYWVDIVVGLGQEVLK